MFLPYSWSRRSFKNEIEPNIYENVAEITEISEHVYDVIPSTTTITNNVNNQVFQRLLQVFLLFLRSKTLQLCLNKSIS